MAYTPTNIDAYTNAYSGAIAGMAVSGWLVDPAVGNYTQVSAIAGAFAEAFDTVWDDATTLNWLQIQTIQSVCQEQFRGHAPGSLNNALFTSTDNWAVAAAACAALVLEGDAYVAGQGITPNTPGGGGGGSFAPIQNTRYLAPLFVGTSNGSIGAPYATWAAFFAESIPVDVGSWMLVLPAGGDEIEPDTGIPDLEPAAGYTFQGAGRDVTIIDELAIAEQSSNTIITFRDLSINELTLAQEEITLVFENCRVSAIVATGAINGNVKMVNCELNDAALGDDVNLTMYDGTITGTCSFGIGEFHDTLITDTASDATVLIPGPLRSRFIDCRYSGSVNGVTISNANTPEIELDPFSWDSFRTSGCEFVGTLRFAPTIYQVGSVQFNGTAIGANSTEVFNCGPPIGSAPPAEPATPLSGSFGNDVGSSALVLQDMSIDVDGNILARVANTSASPVTPPSPTLITIVYSPSITPQAP